MELSCQSLVTVLTKFTKVYLVWAACVLMYVYLFLTTMKTSVLNMQCFSEASSKSIQLKSKRSQIYIWLEDKTRRWPLSSDLRLDVNASFWGPQVTAPPHVALASVTQTQDLITRGHRDEGAGVPCGKVQASATLAPRPDSFYQMRTLWLL